MRSMTGFGLGELSLNSSHLQLEIRSVNHRYVDVRVRLPHELSEFSFYLEQQCRKVLPRGRYDIELRLQDAKGSEPAAIDSWLAAAKQLVALRDAIAPGQDVPLELLASLAPPKSTARFEATELRAVLDQLVDSTLASLLVSRSREGEVLKTELLSRGQKLRELRLSVEAMLPRLLADYRQRLETRLAELLSPSSHIDSQRLELEVAILAERSDVAEELSRLSAHLDHYDSLLNEGPGVGRKFDFLLQELGREINTLGSKCHDVEVNRSVIELKSELEKIREQVQNVE